MMDITVNMNKARCYRVASEKSGNLYDIDLTDLDGNGRCDCADFVFRLEDRVQLGEWGLRCKHIIAARMFDRVRGGRR
jgi:hypothetical protein